MSRQTKSELYGFLKESGYKFDKHYREYNLDELREICAEYPEAGNPLYKAFFTPAASESTAVDQSENTEEALPSMMANVPVREIDENEMAGQRLNTHANDEPIRIDENGLVWYQEEVRKPAYPKPRGRRVLRYNDPGVKKEEVRAGQFTESFEVPGDQKGVSSEIKITLPSYQVGIYRDPRFPFKIHVYNDVRGFDFFEVNDFYGGSDLVPDGIKRSYVDNVLCYDIRTVVRAIEEEHRQLQLTGRI